MKPENFTIKQQRDNEFRIFKDGKLIEIPRNINGFFTCEQAEDWLKDFISSYNRAFENKNVCLDEFYQFYLDIKKSDKEKLIDLLNNGILKSTDTYGNIIVSRLADYIIENETIVKHLL